MKSISIFLLTLIIASCSAIPTKQLESILETKSACCKEMSEFKYSSLKVENEERFVLNEQSPVYIFGNEKSYFKSFELDISSNRVLFVKSYFNGIKIGQFLQPVFHFLDTNFKTITALTPRQEFEDGNLFRDSNASMVGGVRIPSNAKYVVVYAGKFSSTDSAIRDASVGVFMAGKTPIITRNSGISIPLERAPVGELLLKTFDVSR